MQNTDNVHAYSLPRRSRRSIDHEVVEDSEPEREALRQTQRLERKKRKLAAMQPLDLPLMATAIEISDDSIPASPAARSAGMTPPLTSATSVIEISDSSASMSEPPSTKDVSSLQPSMDKTADIVTVPRGAHIAPPRVAISTSDASDDEEIVPTLNLAHFAFTHPRPLQPRNFSSVAGSHSSDTQAKAPPPPAKTVARGSSSRLAGDFPDAELKKLDKCVSCDIAWTSRKSGPQKMVHIRSCGKKNGLTDDTLRILIRREIDNAPSDAGLSKGKSKAPAGSSTASTLLEDVVREAAPKRKGKRKEAVDVLKSVSDTRETILGRARILLEPGKPDEHSFVAQTQAFTSTAPTIAPKPTQAFRVSRLGQRHGSKLSLLGEHDSDVEPELPPATQVFAPSKLGVKLGSRGWGYESESEHESSAPGSDLDVSPVRKSNKPLIPSAKEVPSPRAKGKSPAVLPFPAQLESDDWEDDDAYVHFDSEFDKESVSENIIPTKNPGTKSPKSKRRKNARAVPTAPKRRSRKKADHYDETWELGLKDKIKNDLDLHLRILRYEPINFEVFLQLASDDGEVVGGLLKLHLRAFLDKQGINFYGGEGKVGRR